MEKYPEKDEILDLVIELKKTIRSPNRDKIIELILNNLYVKYMVNQADLMEWKNEVKVFNKIKNKSKS